MFQESAPELLAQWVHFMRQGDFAAAWKISDVAVRLGHNRDRRLPKHLQQVWDGGPLQGRRVLVRCYHGLGDTIQFIRFLPLLKTVAAEVIASVPPRLVSLFSKSPEVSGLIWCQEVNTSIYEVEIELMELPHFFRTTIENIPPGVSYEIKPETFSDEGRLHVGLVWRAGDWNDRRSIPFEQLLPIFELPNLSFHILQQNAAEAGWREGLGQISGGYDILEDAQLLPALDLLITVDTMPAHLAGALGVPVWTLLRKESDWRWMTEREDTPWYPTMRLFRQLHDGDWKNVIDRAVSQLNEEAEE